MPNDEELAKKLLNRADKILNDVDNAFIIHQRGHHQRAMPSFRAEEITLGQTLGQGGFGIVSEIGKFTLDEEVEGKVEAGSENPQESTVPPSEGANQGNGKRRSTIKFKDSEIRGSVVDVAEQPEEVSFNDHVHYDVTKARLLMATRSKRHDKARYAIKRLHGSLTSVERARGMIDLAVEAKYLSMVWHPNIVKLRGIAAGEMVDPGFFIILDRLHSTLDVRLKEWAVTFKAKGGQMCALFRKKKELRELLIERLTVAYDLAAAFFYLHENRIVYRDIKPENIGFDARGDVKVFDFGLCKSLSPALKAKDGGYGYRLTGRAGSLPYMAPEVVRMETYDTKCDVFSFAILLWEMMSLKEAFDGMTPSAFVEKVVVARQRPRVQKEWPALTRLMIPEAWDDDAKKRPDMKRMAVMIRGDLNDMTSDEDVLHRTQHMANRSRHSFRENLEEIVEGEP